MTRILVSDCRDATRQFYGIEPDEWLSRMRPRRIARPRQMAMFLARELTNSSLPDIGRRFGNRDHTTVLHAERRIKALADESPKFALRLGLVRAAIITYAARREAFGEQWEPMHEGECV